jgi:P-type Ca2+ transporter type 2C
MAERVPESLTPAPGSAAPQAWYTQSGTAAAGCLGVAVQRGLTNQEARTRLARSGPNLLHEARPLSFWKVFLEEVREPMILLLLGTGILYSVWGKLEDALTILCVILLLVGAEVFNEYRAKKAMAGLSHLSEPTALVRRQRQDTEVPVEEIVLGDLIG